MIYPSIAELIDHTGVNRYTLVIAAAKSARVITDEYVRQREYAEKIALSKETEKGKGIANLIKREYRDDKAVKLAVAGLYNGEFRILSPEEAEAKRIAEEKAAEEAKAAAEAAAEADATSEGEAEAESEEETAGETVEDGEESVFTEESEDGSEEEDETESEAEPEDEEDVPEEPEEPEETESADE